MFQKVIIAGNLGGDPELRSTPTGQQVCSFSVATNCRFNTQAGEQRDETVWFRVSVWGRQAETCHQYLRKGRAVLCEGRMTPDAQTGGPRVWTDQNNSPRASYELTAMTVKFLGGRDESGGHGDSHRRTDHAPPAAEMDDLGADDEQPEEGMPF